MKFQQEYNFVPWIGEKPYTQNVVLVIFQHNNIHQDCWKNTRSTFECMVILKSRGQGPKKMENYGTNLSRTFNKNLDLVPWIGE